ncbi:hypothetical protein [Marinobacter sp. MBR-105]|jgi:hypothetical protein
MRKLKANQKHSCDFCRAAGVKAPAIWRSEGFYEHACEAHKPEIEAIENKRAQREGRMTEADHQTWGRL